MIDNTNQLQNSGSKKINKDLFKHMDELREVNETPLLFIDINLGEDHPERIIIYEGDSPKNLAKKFCEKH